MSQPEKTGAGASPRPGPFRRLRGSTHLVPLVCIGAVVLAVNLPELLHLVTTNPLVLNADLVTPRTGLLPGLPYVDPNAGFTAQALGHLAAMDWVHGHIPWWDPFEGIGSPLAGEMQSGAFFPTTLLLLLPHGTLLVQIALELTSGWSTYFLVRRLGVGRVIATSSGVAFALCGTFAWIAHAPDRPMALLPLCLLGVERSVAAAREGRPGGWRLLGVALALSILAGFPEVTFIDGLFVAGWAALRVVGPARTAWPAALRKLACGGVVGLAVGAPLLVAFTDYLPDAYVGGHGGAFAFASASPTNLVQLILPYSLGPIDGFRNTAGVAFTLGGTSGYLTVTLIAAALVGLVGRRQRSLRIGLGAWMLVCLLRTYGFPPALHALSVVPGVKDTAFFLWADGTWQLAAIVLAALGLDDIARRAMPRRALAGTALLTAIVGGWAALTASPLMRSASGDPGPTPLGREFYPLASAILAAAALALLAAGGWLAGRRAGPDSPESGGTSRAAVWGRLLMAGTVGAESLILFAFTTASAPHPAVAQAGSALWLQQHLGASRFTTLGPIAPNYGSYYAVAEANVNDLPVPKAYNNFIQAHLDPNSPPSLFTGTTRAVQSGPTPAQELEDNLFYFESLGVRYVVENPDGLDAYGQPFPPTGSPQWPRGPRRVYRDTQAEIWQLPSAAPVFSALSGGCTVEGDGWDRATVRCRHRTVLLRRVLYVPGWTATVHDASVPVTEDRAGPPGLLQEVPVPAGTTTVQFTYLPPHEWPAVAAASLALLLLLGSFLTRFARRGAPGGGLEPPTSGSKGRRSAD